MGGQYGNPFAPGWSLYYGGTGNSYFPLGPAGNYANFATIYARNLVANVHIAIPHHHDAGRDDIQILYTDEALKNQIYLSGNDVASPFCTGAAAQSGTACMNLINGELNSLFSGGSVPYGSSLPVTWLNTYSWGCNQSVGGTYTASQLNALASCVRPYTFPSGTNTGSPSNPNPIPSAARDNFVQRYRHRQAAVHEELWFDGLPAVIRLHILQRLVPQRTV